MNGTKRFVFDAEAATNYLCAARTEEGKVVFLLVDAKSPGITVTPHVGFLVSVAEVRFDNVAVSTNNLLGSSGASWATLEAALDKSLPILSAYQVGATQEVFDITCEYTAPAWSLASPSGAFNACKITASIFRLIWTWHAGRLTRQSGASTAAWTRARAFTKPKRPPVTATIMAPTTRTWSGPDRARTTATR